MSGLGSRLELGSLATVDWLGVGLALVTAAVHFGIGVQFFPEPGGLLFLLAAGGFLGAIVLLLVDYRRPLLYLVGIPYTGVQIIAWYAINQPASLTAVGTTTSIDKLTQVALIIVLVLLYRWGA